MKIYNVAGLFSGEAFLKKGGRNISSGDSSFLEGPLSLEIAQGKIINIIKEKTLQSPAESDVNAEGAILCSGWIDSHTHALFCGDRSKEYFSRWGGKDYVEIAQEGGGILSTMEAIESASTLELVEALSKKVSEINKSGTTSLEIKSGYAKTPEGELNMLRAIQLFKKNYDFKDKISSTFLGLHALPKGVKEYDFVQGMIDILPIVKKEGLADYVDAFPEIGFFSLEAALRFARAAKELGFKSKVHADEITNMQCVEYFSHLGAVSVDHLQKVSKEGVLCLAQKESVATVLPATSFFLDLPYVDARHLLEKNARVALATDYNPGTAPEFRMSFSQLLAASRLKMSPDEILCASTFNAAAALEKDSTHGLLLEGFAADMNFFHFETKSYLEELFLTQRKPSKTMIAGNLLS